MLEKICKVLHILEWWSTSGSHATSVYKKMTQQEIEGLGEVYLHRPSAVVSGVLVLVGVIECLVSLACVTISAREACGLHTKGAARLQGLSEGHNRKERLYRWLGQQKTIFPLASSQPPPRAISSSVSAFVPLSSESSSNSTPRKNSDPSALSSSTQATTNASNASNLTQKTSSTHLTPTTQASSNSDGKGGKTGGGKSGNVAHHPAAATKPSLKTSKTPRSGSATQHVHYGPNSLPAGPVSRSVGNHQHQQPCPVHHFAPMMAHPPAMGPYGPMSMPHPPYGPPATHPSMYYPHLVTPMLPHDPRAQQEHQQRPSYLVRKDFRKKKDRKLRYKVSKKEDKKKKKKRRKAKKELTDEQIEKTYTGLDREIAEGFINTAMEPALSLNRAFSASFEEEDSF